MLIGECTSPSLGVGYELDYTIEPEFRLPNIRHRRGAVGMAREDDMDDNGMSRYMENNDEEGWD